MQENIRCGSKYLSIAQQRKSLVAETREGGEASQEADHDEQPGLGMERFDIIGPSSDEADDQTTERIDDQRSDRKRTVFSAWCRKWAIQNSNL